MKWRSKQEGDIRVRKYFAFIPCRCGDGYTRWLEMLITKERLGLSIEGYFWERLWTYPTNDEDAYKEFNLLKKQGEERLQQKDDNSASGD